MSVLAWDRPDQACFAKSLIGDWSLNSKVISLNPGIEGILGLGALRTPRSELKSCNIRLPRPVGCRENFFFNFTVLLILLSGALPWTYHISITTITTTLHLYLFNYGGQPPTPGIPRRVVVFVCGASRRNELFECCFSMVEPLFFGLFCTRIKSRGRP